MIWLYILLSLIGIAVVAVASTAAAMSQVKCKGGGSGQDFISG